ncbi:M48 family metallopeptidase [Stieleria sp. TO1_6]|uniref:M48 family metallopeptidase n=1 Tax=Stieleria tagensis TaxID=2956795 RepID=UPI00209AB6AB|nr:M48 family metallopeptidase [Stieleria tagensis]MCO8125303.1 M48 family metallopeptidase [Stieleria tagensis]
MTIPAVGDAANRVATDRQRTSAPRPSPAIESNDEIDFGSITAQLPSFVAGNSTESTKSPRPVRSMDDDQNPFADLPEFQALDAPVSRHSQADNEFHQMMMADSGQSSFVLPTATPLDQSTPAADADALETEGTSSPVADHSNLADVLGGFDATIQSAVQQQRAKTERAARAKFSRQQIQAAFAKPLGAVDRFAGLGRKQFQSAIAVALVPIGFVVFVFAASAGMLLLYRGWLYGADSSLPHPVIGITFVILCVLLVACWIPAINLMFAGWSLLFGRRHSGESTTQLTRESQPVMYEFVDQICEKLGAPKPCRIDLDCEFNASASLRRGWIKSGNNDLVLTIGIPFIAIQNTEQLASVIAHEFGHFRQGSAMKTSYVIGSLTNWFMRSAASGPVYFYWFGYLTHMLSGSLTRQMEWDADRHAVQLAGTKAFVQSSALIERYGVAYAVTLDNLFMLFQSGILVDNIPRFMMHIGRTMPASVVRRIAEQTEKERLNLLDSHPPTRDRVQAARELNQPGILSLGRPATDLIDHWIPLCKTITLDFYTQTLGLLPNEINDSHVTPLEDLLRDEHKLLLDKTG